MSDNNIRICFEIDKDVLLQELDELSHCVSFTNGYGTNIVDGSNLLLDLIKKVYKLNDKK